MLGVYSSSPWKQHGMRLSTEPRVDCIHLYPYAAFYVFKYGKQGLGHYPGEMLVSNCSDVLREAGSKESEFTSSRGEKNKTKQTVDNIVNQPGDKCLPGLSPAISRH